MKTIKLCKYKANLPSFVKKIIKSRYYLELYISQTSAEMPPKNSAVRKANRQFQLLVYAWKVRYHIADYAEKFQ
jgi:hypothetical protein